MVVVIKVVLVPHTVWPMKRVGVQGPTTKQKINKVCGMRRGKLKGAMWRIDLFNISIRILI
jgi:hypothetical protein